MASWNICVGYVESSIDVFTSLWGWWRNRKVSWAYVNKTTLYPMNARYLALLNNEQRIFERDSYPELISYVVGTLAVHEKERTEEDIGLSVSRLGNKYGPVFTWEIHKGYMFYAQAAQMKKDAVDLCALALNFVLVFVSLLPESNFPLFENVVP